MFFHSGVIIAPSSNYKAANYVKDENPTLEKVPSNHKVANHVKFQGKPQLPRGGSLQGSEK